MKRFEYGIAAVLAAACLLPAAHAAVTLTEADVVLNPATPTVTTPCWVFQNDYLQIAVVKATGRIPAVIKLTGSAANSNQAVVAYPAFMDWAQQKSPPSASIVITANPDGDDSDAKRSLKVTGTIDTTVGTTFNVTKIYRLRDKSKAFEADMTFVNNNTTTDWLPADPYNGVCEVVYDLPGGSGTAGDQIQVKTSAGLETPTATTWFGWAASGTIRPELLEGWLATVNLNNTCSATVTWDSASQRTHSPSGVSATRAGVFGSRYQVNPSFTKVTAGETLNYKQYLIVDDGIKTVSYASPEAFIGGIELSGSAFPQGSTVGVTYGINSTKTSEAASYDLKNVRLLDSTGATMKTLPDILGIAVAANQHATATRQFTLANDIDTAKTYAVAADVYLAGDATRITTLLSKAMTITPANVKVALYQDPNTQDWILENENLKAVINNASGQVYELDVKSVSRNQASSGYPMFRDATAQTTALDPFAYARQTFSGFQVVLDPNGTDSPTKKSISFQNGYNVFANLNKTFTLESTSKSLQTDFSLVNVTADPIANWGFYSDVASQVGGSGGAEDQLTVHAASGLLYNFPVPVDPGYTRFWFGCIPQPDNSTLMAGAQPELDQPWIAASDTNNGDALATTWDRGIQVANSSKPTDGSSAVTLNCVFRGGENAVGEGRRHVMETHYDNIPALGTLNYTLYTVADTGMKTVSFAEGKRVMAGIWNNGGDVNQGANLSFTLSITNVGTTERTFNVPGFRLVKDTGETTSFGPILDPAPYAAGANVTAALTYAVPSDLALGTYHLEADLFETGGAGGKVATLASLPFKILAGLPAPTGDVNGDGKVDSADVTLALNIAAGLTTATADNVAKGDLWPATPDKALTMEDAVAIARKAGGL